MATATRRRSKRDEQAIKWRAVAAFARFVRPGQPQASFDDAKVTIVEVRNKSYVVLTSGKRTLAVFRIRTDGMLKRLRRPPRELQGEE